MIDKNRNDVLLFDVQGDMSLKIIGMDGHCIHNGLFIPNGRLNRPLVNLPQAHARSERRLADNTASRYRFAPNHANGANARQRRFKRDHDADKDKKRQNEDAIPMFAPHNLFRRPAFYWYSVQSGFLHFQSQARQDFIEVARPTCLL